MSQLAQQLNKAWLRRGPLATALWPLSWLMAAIVRMRRLGFAQGWLASHRLPVPVIVVGNRVVGGAGKTPTTIALLQHLTSRGWRPGVLSRGYKADIPGGERVLLDTDSAASLRAGQTGDEPMLIWRRTGVPLMVGRDRVAGGRALLRAHPEIDVLVCDDGLQHLRLQRDIEIIVFDGRGAGNGWLLPAGPLREPVHTKPMPTLRATPLVLYNAAQPSTDLPGHVAATRMARLVPLKEWWLGAATASADSSALAVPLPPELRQASGQPGHVWAAAGIAQPQRFFDSLRRMGITHLDTLALADHAKLDNQIPWPDRAREVIVTEKDAVKLDPQRLARERPGCRVWVAALDLQPEASFWRVLDDALPHRRSPADPPPAE
jgi:tetraacyldisaccharide 4'-kinase